MSIIIEHHKGRKSIDHDYLRKIFDKDDREALQKMIDADPHSKHRYPWWTLKATMGYVPFNDRKAKRGV